MVNDREGEVVIMRLSDISVDWMQDSKSERGRVLTGLKAHWCWDWDFMTVDETCEEYESCTCACYTSSNDEALRTT